MLTVRSIIALMLSFGVSAPFARAQTAGTPPVSPPGRLVDVGGWRLHINCTGEARPGRPTVILESGVGDFSVEWSLVQPTVASFARTCSYDRAGDGWSDIGPYPRTFHQIVYELHTLLERAGEKPPFVLVGHSYGGWLVRLYQVTYPSDVSGMVLVEAGADDPLRVLPNRSVVRASTLVTGATVPPVQTSNPLKISDIPPDALRAAGTVFKNCALSRANSQVSTTIDLLAGGKSSNACSRLPQPASNNRSGGPH